MTIKHVSDLYRFSSVHSHSNIYWSMCRSIYVNLCVTFALRLLGVGRVVIYNTSCGPELDRLLQIYSQDGFLEIVQWPIHQHLIPSTGWLFSEHGGDVHYFGQLATLNECIYRSMERSRYVLLNDVDEIIMPYQHDNLMSMMNMLQEQHPNVGYFSSVFRNNSTFAHFLQIALICFQILLFHLSNLNLCSAGWGVRHREPFLSQETLWGRQTRSTASMERGARL